MAFADVYCFSWFGSPEFQQYDRYVDNNVIPHAPSCGEDDYVLEFAGDTWIQTDIADFPATTITMIEAEAYIIPISVANRHIWADDVNNYGRISGTNITTMRWGGTSRAYGLLEWTDNTWYHLQFDHTGAGSCTGILAEIGGASLGQTLDLGTTGVNSLLTIGAAAPGNFAWEGYIRNLKVWTDTGGGLVLRHHWPIDDNVGDGGTIVDVVGGADGTLTLGSGKWVKLSSTGYPA